MDLGRKKYTPRKEEFIGWGSKKLLFFLASIGRSVNEPISQSEVYDIIVDYIKENNLLHPQKKKKVICDANLHSLLHRKSINKNRISGLLETHFPENQYSDDESLIGARDELEEDTISVAHKRQRSDLQISKSVSVELNEMALEAQRRSFASITEKNIKLVYLRRSLLEKFVQAPETIESKVVDCIIRIKADLNCYHLPKTPFQLVQVTGVERASKSYRTGDVGTDIVLKVSNAMKDIQIFMVSDDDFTEEECKDLQDRIKEGHLKRLTVGEMEEKARSLHEDITNHWIDREILLLKNRIDRANEKGWRRELHMYIDQLEQLQCPAQRMKILGEPPKVAADEEILLECPLKSFADAERINEGTDVAKRMDHEASADLMGSEKQIKVKEADIWMASEIFASVIAPKREDEDGNQATPSQKSSEIEMEGNGDQSSWNVGNTGTEESKSSIYSFFFGTVNATDGKADERVNEGTTVAPKDSRQQNFSLELMHGTVHRDDGELRDEKPAENKDVTHEKSVILLEDDENEGNTDVTKDLDPSFLVSNANGSKETQPSITIIDIDDDDGELPCVTRIADEKASRKDGGAEMKQSVVIVDGRKQVGIGRENHQIWHYLDPEGRVQGPFRLSALKARKEHGYFSKDFIVWEAGKTPENGILFTDAMRCFL